MARSTSEDSERLHLLVPAKTKAILERLQKRTNAGSKTEVIRRAIALYDAISDEAEGDPGSSIIVRAADGTETKLKII